MITRFYVNNFKSLLNAEFRPVGLNLLIGPNNAGKTNLCSALRFLGLASEHPLDKSAQEAVGERWNLANVYIAEEMPIEFEMECDLQDGKERLHFTYAVSIDVKSMPFPGGSALSVEDETLSVTGGAFTNQILLKNSHGMSKMLCEPVNLRSSDGDQHQFFGGRIVTNATALSQIYNLEKSNRTTILFRNYLKSWAYFNFSPDALRIPEVTGDGNALMSNGANLSRVLYTLHNEEPRLERKLIELMKPVEPKLDLFSFSSPDPDHVYMFFEDDKGHKFGTKSVSDGTLRFLALAYILLTCDQTATVTGFRPVTIIEEPENGLYVGHLKPLIQRIDPSGATGQYVFTSHSPYFIDLFDNNLPGIHLVKKGNTGSVLTKPNEEKINKLLGDMSLGEMHFRELLS